jgi:hypothetical protein
MLAKSKITDFPVLLLTLMMSLNFANKHEAYFRFLLDLFYHVIFIIYQAFERTQVDIDFFK